MEIAVCADFMTLVLNAEDVSSLMLKEKLIAKPLAPITELIDDRFLKKIINKLWL